MEPNKKTLTVYDLVSISVEAALDAACVTDMNGAILRVNGGLIQLLRLKKSEIARRPCFSSLVKIEEATQGCPVMEALKSGKILRFDDMPAKLRGVDAKITIKCTPFFHPESPGVGKPLGVIVQLRDTTVDLKVHESMKEATRYLKKKTSRVAELEAKTRSLIIQSKQKSRF